MNYQENSNKRQLTTNFELFDSLQTHLQQLKKQISDNDNSLQFPEKQYESLHKVEIIQDIVEQMFGQMAQQIDNENKINKQEQSQDIHLDYQEQLAQMRAQIQQKQAKYKLKKTQLQKEIEKLNQEIKIYRENSEQYRNEMTQNFKEQKKHQGKMETWFIRRLEKLELIVLDQHNPDLNNIILKIRKFKKKRPWKNIQKQSQNLLNNSKNITNINNKKTINTLQSDGTTTPFSNYSEFSSEDAESHDKTINKGFIISQATSHRSTVQQLPLYSNDSLKNLQQQEDIITKNPQKDLNLSVSQLEQLMLNYLQHTDRSQNVTRLNLKDVQLEDLLNVTQQNNSVSMDLDFHKDQKQPTIQNTSFEKLINSFASKQMSRQFNKNKEISQDNFPQELSSIDLSHMKSQNNSFQNINNISCIEKDFRKKSNTCDFRDKTGKSAILFLNEIQEECKDLESPASKRNLNEQFQEEADQQKQQNLEFNSESNNKFLDCSPFNESFQNTANVELKNMNETVNYEDKQQFESPKKLKNNQELEQNNQEQNNKNIQENIAKTQNNSQPNKLNLQKNKKQDEQNKDQNDQFQILMNKYNSANNFTNHESTSSPIDQSLFTEKNQEMAKKLNNLNFKQISWNEMSPKINNQIDSQKPIEEVKIRLRPKQLKIQHKSCDGRQQLMESSPIIKKKQSPIKQILNNNNEEQKQNTNQTLIQNCLRKPLNQIQNNQFKPNIKTEENIKPVDKQIQYNSNNVNISLNLKDQQINIRNQFMKKDKAKPMRAKILSSHQSNINNSNLNISVNSNDSYQYDNCQTPFQQNLPMPLQNQNVDRSLSSEGHNKGMYFEMNGIQQQLQLLEQHHSINLQQQKSFQSGLLSLYSPVNNINLFINNNQNQDMIKNNQNNMVNSISTKNDNEIKRNILKNAIQLANQKKKQESMKVTQNQTYINHIRPKSNILSTSFQYKGKENSDKNQIQKDIILKGLQGNVSIKINNQEKLKSINRVNSISTHCTLK